MNKLRASFLMFCNECMEDLIIVKLMHVEEQIIANGFPAYTTSAGWLGYTEERIKKVRS